VEPKLFAYFIEYGLLFSAYVKTNSAYKLFFTNRYVLWTYALKINEISWGIFVSQLKTILAKNSIWKNLKWGWCLVTPSSTLTCKNFLYSRTFLDTKTHALCDRFCPLNQTPKRTSLRTFKDCSCKLQTPFCIDIFPTRNSFKYILEYPLPSEISFKNVAFALYSN